MFLILDLYINKQISINKISKQLSISRYILTDLIKSENITTRNRWESATKYKNVDKELILISLKNISSIRQAVKYCNVPYATFRKAVLFYNIEYNSSKSVQHPV